ncbi:MAG TPA: serine/threonine-protein kinase [Solirubrobacteraceae bacterium]|jgi:serine/threonine-protein kinase
MDSLHDSMAVAGYRIDGTLGEGGMGAVYRATQLSLERVVALKVLTVELSSDPAFRERFRREGLLQAALDHPHIVTVYEAGETDSRLFLAMRMVEGPTLKELIQKRQLDDRRALRLLTQVAEALDAAHARGLIHRDVKPHNVLIGAGDHAYLADFGLTKAHDDAGMTETGQFVGTIDYISPEQARGEHGTAGSDVYALTAVLCECLTGRAPYVKATEDRVLMAHLSEPAPRLSELRSDLPAAIDEVVAEGMAKDPGDRPVSAGELMLKARRALGAAPASAAAPAGDGDPLDLSVGAPTRASHPTVQGDPGATRLAGTVLPKAAPEGVARRGFAAALGGAAVLAAAAGFLLGAGSSGSGETFSNSASAGHLELSFPAGWRRLGSTPTIPGIVFSQPLALTSSTAAANGEQLLAGEVRASSGPSLLPAAFTGALNGAAPHPEPVRLGALEAYRYRALSVRGLTQTVTLYVLPTAGGVATIACLSPSAAATTTQCAQIAATLKLSATTAFGLSPSPVYAAALRRALGALRGAADSATSSLHTASSASAQAAAATRLAAAYNTAQAALEHLTTSPAVEGLNAGLAGSLAALGRDYTALASAARAADSAAYGRAVAAVGRDRTGAAKALTALGQAGYVVSG